MCYEVTEKTKVPNAAIKKYESILKYIFPKITILFLANVMFNCSKNKHNLQLQSWALPARLVKQFICKISQSEIPKHHEEKPSQLHLDTI